MFSGAQTQKGVCKCESQRYLDIFIYCFMINKTQGVKIQFVDPFEFPIIFIKLQILILINHNIIAEVNLQKILMKRRFTVNDK